MICLIKLSEAYHREGLLLKLGLKVCQIFLYPKASLMTCALLPMSLILKRIIIMALFFGKTSCGFGSQIGGEDRLQFSREGCSSKVNEKRTSHYSLLQHLPFHRKSTNTDNKNFNMFYTYLLCSSQ